MIKIIIDLKPEITNTPTISPSAWQKIEGSKSECIHVGFEVAINVNFPEVSMTANFIFV